MYLTKEGLKDTAAWKKAGFALPCYDRETMQKATLASPDWLHFGPGNLFKAFHAHIAETLLNTGASDTGVIAVGRRKKQEDPHDGYVLLATLKASGDVEKTVIGSVAADLFLYGDEAELTRIFCSPSLQMATFTITEKGYRIYETDGSVLQELAADLSAGPERANSYLGKIAALLYARYCAGASPLALVSTDNCSHNGDKLKAAIRIFSDEWEKAGLVRSGFAAYIADGTVSFPCSMIDKITPAADPKVAEMLARAGVSELNGAFVNAEETEYLFIEDNFPNGRPPLEKAGVVFTTRETVDKVERMKVCTCLNPLHTALAIYGCLLGHTHIYAEMRDPELSTLIRKIGYGEGMPVVTNPGIIQPEDFLRTVLEVRFPNPFMPDTPQRIATDTSQKLAVRFGETVKSYVFSDTHHVEELKFIPLVYAGWLRYLMAVDDNGMPFTPSPDPMLQEASAAVSAFRLGDRPEHAEIMNAVSGLLSNQRIWGLDLIAAGLGDLIADYFAELIAGTGAVRSALAKYTGTAC